MLKALIIDDELRASSVLQLMVERYVPDVERIWSCNDARQAAPMIHELKPDLVFLDIQMPHLDGFQVLQQIRQRSFKVIFTTAFSEFALQAIRFSAFDYLLKPIEPEELMAAVQRYQTSLDELAFQPEQFRNGLSNLQAKSPEQFRLAVSSKDGIHFFPPNEIIRLEALGSYTQFHLTERRKFLASKGLGEYEELLAPHGFLRTHKSHLVNRSFISFLDHEGYLVLRNDARIEVSRRRKEEVVKAMKAI
ncbi:MAG: LytTR family DNA-binding domain-containing protein [Saprospiraceae bacterium]|nr:LytTR family DNA-binding domain-containing protein [Saprospiraceae bacterium]MCF8281464.1 LytTR family DNA-binding domain-containing protein [Bacteroidales bacterium]MCF8442253.1 LytTR family DNA-binding domain-containing protein [Saprospiraceae bacterium]